ncbi:hypothetical protein VIGAN_08044800, partial [Vigna angularis var. angularis]
ILDLRFRFWFLFSFLLPSIIAFGFLYSKSWWVWLTSLLDCWVQRSCSDGLIWMEFSRSVWIVVRWSAWFPATLSVFGEKRYTNTMSQEKERKLLDIFLTWYF